MVKNIEFVGPPGQRQEVNGYAFWHAAGRLFVCISDDVNRQTSALFRTMPEDADVQGIIHAMGRRLQGAAKQ